MRSINLAIAACFGTALLSACSGQSTLTPVSASPVPVATATPTPAATAVPTATPAPTATPTVAPTATPKPTTAPTATPTPASSLAPSVERQVAQADLSAIEPILIQNQLEQGLSAKSLARKPLFARARDLSATCSNATEFSTSSSGNTTNFTLLFFYDTACTQPWQTIVGKEVGTSTASGESEAVTASDTVDGTSGMQILYDAISGTITEGQTSETFAFSASTGPTANNVKGQLGSDCTIAGTATGTTESCSFGGLSTLPAFMGYTGFGTVVNETSNLVVTSTGFSANGSGTGTYYEGTAPPTMQLDNNGTLLSIVNAAVQKSISVSETVASGSGATPTAMLTITDQPDNAIVTVNLSGYTIDGTIENYTTKAVEATFTLDVNGNGTIKYSDGTTGTIVAFGIT